MNGNKNNNFFSKDLNLFLYLVAAGACLPISIWSEAFIYISLKSLKKGMLRMSPNWIVTTVLVPIGKYMLETLLCRLRSN